MPALLELLAIIVLLVLVAQFLFGVGLFKGRGAIGQRSQAAVTDQSPAKRVADRLKALENDQATLRAEYPAVFGMLGGYLNAHTIQDAGGLEGAVKEMIADWTPRREEVKAEIVRLLAENESEEEVRAIVVSACDAGFDGEGYRNWMIWLLGRFNAL
ncbi:MAG: hypothetical protein VX640_10665 [Pseudomonadota bacterium]|nr:hypothetical protein [Pseudomonadota bacterium]